MAAKKVSDQALLEAIVMLRAYAGRAPTLRELATVTGLQSSGISFRLRKLAERGLVDLGQARAPRQIQVTAAGRQIALSDVVEVPLLTTRRLPQLARRAA